MPTQPDGFQTKSRRVVHENRPWLVVEQHEVEFRENGVVTRTIEDWAWVETPDYVCVLPIFDDGRCLCFEQCKYGVEGTTLSTVAGLIDPGENPLMAAKRELREEASLEASNWVPLGGFRVDGNRGAGIAHLFLARELHPTADKHASDDIEPMSEVYLDRTGLLKALSEGKFKILAPAALAALALPHLAG
jgi:ADP-ribose pyrophosphatase